MSSAEIISLNFASLKIPYIPSLFRPYNDHMLDHGVSKRGTRVRTLQHISLEFEKEV